MTGQTDKIKVVFLMAVAWALMGNPINAQAQTGNVRKELKEDQNRASGTYYAMPVAKALKNTPVPGGKQPFYINHYGCPTSYYLPNAEDYETPYAIFVRADSLGKLTKLGRDVLRRLDLLRRDAHNRTGELTTKGAQQSRELMRQLVEHLPSAFTEKGYYSGRSIVENHTILTMEEAMAQLSSMRQPLSLLGKATHMDYSFMNPQDKQLTDRQSDSLAMALYTRFLSLNTNDTRLIESLFNDQNFVIININAAALSRSLFRLAGCIQHTDLAGKVTLYDIFTPEEIYRNWRKQNARDYLHYGGCTLNGGTQPYLQRATLRNMIHMGDSMTVRNDPMMHLRFTNESVIMALASLMELDNCGVQTDNLDSLEALGWANYRIAPLGGSIVMIHYRSDKNDPDILVKVLHNGREARLPIETDCAPYYHWQDVKRYYLRKLYRYENIRFKENSIRR
jgi:hypothetical protein